MTSHSIDPWFYGTPQSRTLSDVLTHLTQHKLWADHPVNKDMDDPVHGTSNLKDAEPAYVTYFTPPKFGAPDYAHDLKHTQAGFVLVTPECAQDVPDTSTAILTPYPYRAFAVLIQFFYNNAIKPQACGSTDPSANIHPTAVVDPRAVIEAGVDIGPLCYVGPRAHIQKHTHLMSHVSVGEGVKIGSHCRIEPHVTLQYADIGHHVYIKTGARIGQDGFGFEFDARGPIDMPQMGIVRIGDHVKIGSNTCIDRATLHETVIHTGARIDNLVQVAHNVNVGAYSVLVAQVGIAGSTSLGQGVMAGGQVGISGHLSIGDGARIAAQSGVMRDIPPKTDVAGSPSIPARDWHKQTLFLKRAIKAASHKK